MCVLSGNALAWVSYCEIHVISGGDGLLLLVGLNIKKCDVIWLIRNAENAFLALVFSQLLVNHCYKCKRSRVK